jgi:hypothetical protein
VGEKRRAKRSGARETGAFRTAQEAGPLARRRGAVALAVAAAAAAEAALRRLRRRSSVSAPQRVRF